MIPFARLAPVSTRSLLLRGASAFALLGGTASAASAASVSGNSTIYIGPSGDANWSTPGNWSNGVPNSGSAAIVNNGNTVNTDGGNSTDTLTISTTSGVTLGSNTSLTVGSAITNQGLITINSYYGTGLLTNGPVALSGGGTITLTNGPSYIGGSGSLSNADNLIQGMGTVGNGQIALSNGAAGIINANNGTLTLNPTTLANQGLAQASGGGNLDIRNTTITQSGNGTILATGANSTVGFTNTAVTGGTISTAAGGATATSGTNTLTNLTISNGSTFTTSNNSTTYLGGTITNNGTLATNAYYTTEYRIAGGTTTTLTGGGTLLLGGDGNSVVRDADASTGTLVNVNNTITGAGNVGNGQLHLVNQTAGLVDAAAGNSLTVQANSTGVDNSGTLRASGGGTLTLTNSAVNQVVSGQPTTGTILATGAGSTVLLSNSSASGGTLSTTNGGAFATAGTNRLANVTVSGGSTFTNTDQANTYLDGTITNKGTLVANSYYGSEFRVSSGQTTTLVGGGTVTLNGVNARIRDADSSSGTLVNTDNTINGYGGLGNGQLGLNNQVGGTVNANSTGNTLYLNTNVGTTNAGTLSATNGGTLNIQNTAVTQAATGLILADGSVTANGNTTPSTVTLTNSSVSAGTLTTRNGGLLQTAGTNSLNNVTLSTGSTLTANDQTTTYLGGTLNNQGTVNLNSFYGSELRVGAGATTTLTGGGTISINGQNATIRDADASTGVLVNTNNTISGIGSLGAGQLGIDNRAAGVINANNASGTLYLQGNGSNGSGNLTGVSNAGLAEATNGGTLQVNNTTVTQTGAGSIQAKDGSTVTLAGSTINGGVLTTTGSGVMQTSGTNSLNNVTLSTGSTLTARDQTTTYLGGTVNNQGTVNLNSFYGSELRVGAGATTTLTGGGTISMNGQNATIRDADAATGVLVNMNNTISGIGNLGNGQLGIDNRAAGVINANNSSGTLYLQGNGSNGSGNLTGVSNAGLAEATNGGTLQVNNTTVTQTGAGSIQAKDGSTVTLAGSTINGGVLTTTGSGVMQTSGTNSLNNVTLSTGSTLTARDQTTTYLGGTVNNQGTVNLNSFYGSELRVGAGATTTLTGGGTINLVNGNSVFRDADAGTGTLVNTNNTITGAGNLGNGQLAITNGAAGTLLANGATLTVNTNGAGLTNNGTIQATAGGTANVVGGPLTNYAAGTLTGGIYRADANSTVNLNTAGITTNAATIVLNGAGSAVNTQAGAVEGTLTTNAQGGSLQILAGRNYATANDVTNSGAVQLGGGTLSPNSLTNTATGTLTGFGTVAPTAGGPVANAGTVTAAGGTLNLSTGISGTGTLASSTGATASLASGPATNSVGTLALNGGTLALGTNNVTVGSDYTNTAFGTGNGFSKRADVTGSGAINAAGDTAQAITGAKVVNGTSATPTIALGDFHTTDANHATGGASTTYQVANTGTAGASLRGAIQTTGITDSRLSGTGVTAQNFGPVATGSSSGAYTISVAGSSAGQLTNQSIHVANNFSNVAEQTVAVTGTGYNYAQATNIAGNTINLGNFRVGSTQQQALTIGNVAPNGAFTEKLDGAAGTASGSASVSGGFTGLAAGSTSNAVSVGLNTATAGAKTGSATINFTSNAAGVDSLGNSALPSQTVNVTGNAFRLATGSAATPVSVGNVHVGDTAQATLAVTNTAANDGFSEKLNAAVSGTTGAVSGTTGSVSLLGAGATSNAITASLNTATAGAKTGTVGLNYASDGTGTTGAAASANGTGSVTVTGNVYNLASSSTIGTVNFGVLHTGTGTQTQTVSVTNTAAAGNYSEGLNTSFGTYTNNGGLAVTSSGAVTNLAAGSTDSSSLKLSVSTAVAGQVNGTIQVRQSSNGTISGLADTALPNQNPAVTGQVVATVANYAQAQINTAQPVAFGNVRVGTTQQQALSITNAAPDSQYSERLIAGVAGTSGGVTASGGFGPPTSVPSLVAQGTDTTHVVVGIDTSTAGAKSGNATLNFKSDGTAFNGGTITNLGNTDVAVAGNVYRLASPTLNTTSLSLASRVGGTASGTISVTNTSPDSFTEGLKASAAAAPANFTSSGSIANLSAGGTDATSLKVGLNTATAGSFSGTQTVNFASTGAGTTGAADQALTAGTVSVSGKVYAAATAAVTPNPVNFGTVHVGDTATRALTVGNTATGALTDTLTGGFGTVSSKFTGSGTLGSGVAAGGTSNALTVGLDTSTSGSFSGSAALALNSHDADLSDAAVSAGPVALSGTVNNYAVAGFGYTSGNVELNGGGTGYTLDFGTVAQNSSPLTDVLYAGNFAPGLADLLSGYFYNAGSSAFSLTGLDPFTGLGAGQTTGPLSVSFGTTMAGLFSDVITLFATGSNSSGYSGAVPSVTLTLRGNVLAAGGAPVPEPGSLAVLGSAIAGLLALRRRLRA